ncbi:MAG: SCO family protein [Porticoccaceae bacterium]|nr:SCO family protein [Porticoccaceae bacterium]
MLKQIAVLSSALLMDFAFAGSAYAQHAHAEQEIRSSGAAASIAEMSLDFELLNGEGEIVRRTDLLGSNLLVAFGFTYCPDVCPVMAANMANALRQSDKDALGVFISVDTERDTPQVTDNYASRFGENMMGLSGTHESVSEAAKNFNVTFVVTKTPNSYTVQHSPGTFLISPTGELIDVFAINADPKDIAAAMQ